MLGTIVPVHPPENLRWQTSRKEVIFLFVGTALFWTLMISPRPFGDQDRVFVIEGLLESFIRVVSTLGLLPQNTLDWWIKHDWEYALEMTLRLLLQHLIFLAFWLGMLLAVSLPGWGYCRPRTRLILWDLLGLLSLIGLLFVGWIYATESPSTQAQTTYRELIFLFHGTALMLWFVFGSLLFGHFGRILFARERKAPATIDG